jgi:hypothetical protein
MHPDHPLLEFFAVSAGTWFVLGAIAFGALTVVRGHLSSLFAMLATVPLILLCSLAVYQASRALQWFNQDKMADWLAWTIIAGTAGTMLAISLVVLAGRLQDRRRSTA